MRSTLRTTCNRDCPDACGIVATVEGGRVLTLAGDPEHPDHTRREFLLRSGLMVGLGVGLAAVGRVVGSGRRHVEETRRLLRLPGVTPPQVPKGVRVDVPDMTSWATPNDEFYRIDTAFAVPTIEP